jgi:hypothetical protein
MVYTHVLLDLRGGVRSPLDQLGEVHRKRHRSQVHGIPHEDDEPE